MKTAKPNQKQAASTIAKSSKKANPVSESVIEEVEEALDVVEPILLVFEDEVPQVIENSVASSENLESDSNNQIPTIQMRDIEKILRKSPFIIEVLLKSGDTVQISTEDFEKLRNPEDPTNTIQYL